MLVPAWVAARWKEARSEVMWHDFGARGFQFGATRLYFLCTLDYSSSLDQPLDGERRQGQLESSRGVCQISARANTEEISDNRKDCPNELLHLFSEGACHHMPPPRLNYVV